MPYKAKNQRIERTCGVCNEKFIAQRIDKVYCSTACSSKVWNKKVRNEFTPEQKAAFLARQREHNKKFTERLRAKKQELIEKKQKPQVSALEQTANEVSRVLERYSLYPSTQSAWIKEY